jgi:hypothetical protein
MASKVTESITTTGGMVAAANLLKLFPETARNMKEVRAGDLSKPSTMQELARKIWLPVCESRSLCGVMLDLTRMYEAKLLVKKPEGFFVPSGVQLSLKYIN